MSGRWTDELVEPIRSATASGRWVRIEEARVGGWILLSDLGEGDVDWWHLPEDGGELEPLDPLADSRLPELRATVTEALRQGDRLDLLAWRVGSRAIFRLDGPAGLRLVKIFRKDRMVLRRWKLLADRSDDAWRVPQVLDWDPDRCRLEIEFCPGMSLNRRWLSGKGEPGDGERVADLLRWLAATKIPEGLPIHTTEDEIRILAERVPVFLRTLARPSDRPGLLVDRVATCLRELPEVPAVLCHRDFHDKQVLLDGSEGTIIDLDLAAGGHPALDVGNIISHLRLRALKGVDLPWQEIAAKIAKVAREDRGIAESLRTWTASTLLRLALIYARRYRAPGLIEALLDSTESALGGNGEWQDVL